MIISNYAALFSRFFFSLPTILNWYVFTMLMQWMMIPALQSIHPKFETDNSEKRREKKTMCVVQVSIWRFVRIRFSFTVIIGKDKGRDIRIEEFQDVSTQVYASSIDKSCINEACRYIWNLFFPLWIICKLKPHRMFFEYNRFHNAVSTEAPEHGNIHEEKSRTQT